MPTCPRVACGCLLPRRQSRPGTAETGPSGPRSLKHLPPGPLQKKGADRWLRIVSAHEGNSFALTWTVVFIMYYFAFVMKCKLRVTSIGKSAPKRSSHSEPCPPSLPPGRGPGHVFPHRSVFVPTGDTAFRKVLPPVASGFSQKSSPCYLGDLSV